MEWKYVKPLAVKESIAAFEAESGYLFPQAFKDCVQESNGGKPTLSAFDTEFQKERAVKSFLSFNKDDRETMWKVNEWNKEELADKYIAFAIDNFGNLICFKKSDDSIVFLDLESMNVEFVAGDFSQFIQSLYE